MSESKTVKNLVIVGSGYGPYLVAHLLCSPRPFGVESITLVDLEEPENDEFIISLSAMRQLHAELKLSEMEFVKQTKAEINLGFDYSGFRGQQATLFCDAQYGFNLHNKRFYYLFRKMLELDPDVNFEHYCLTAKMARNQRFTPPSSNGKSLFSSVNYGYRLTGANYRYYLSDKLTSKPVKVMRSNTAKVNLTDAGYVGSLEVNGELVPVDYIIDLSANRSIKQLLDKSLSTMDYGGLCFHAGKSVSPADHSPPYAAVIKNNNRLILSGTYLQQNHQIEFAWSDDEHALDTYCFDVKPWVKNCLALGLAYSNRPPILIDNPCWLRHCFSQLVTLWPRTITMEQETHNFNRKINALFQQIYQLEQMQLAFAFGRTDCLSDPIAEKFEAFNQRGKVVYCENEILQESQWPVIFSCLGVTPNQVDVSVQTFDSNQLHTELSKMKAVIAKAAESAPIYADFIAPIHR